MRQLKCCRASLGFVRFCVRTRLQLCLYVCLTKSRRTVFGYFILLFILSILKYKDDTAIWSWSVRKLIWQHTRKTALPPLPPLPSFRNQVQGIAAPRPRRIITVPEPGLSYRSGLGLDYQIEHYQPPALGITNLEPSTDRPLSPLSLILPTSPTPLPPTKNLPQKPLPAAFAPFYPSYVQAAIHPGISRTSTGHSSCQVRNLPGTSFSPPPLGDWPRRDATSLPARGKRKQNPPAPYSFTMPTATQQRRDEPRPRPSGPRRRSTSGDLKPLSP